MLEVYSLFMYMQVLSYFNSENCMSSIDGNINFVTMQKPVKQMYQHAFIFIIYTITKFPNISLQFWLDFNTQGNIYPCQN